jgi:copper homeostasis protein
LPALLSMKQKNCVAGSARTLDVARSGGIGDNVAVSVMNKRILLEVAVASAADAVTAASAGADRLEINAALELDGLTPTPGAVAGAQRAGLPIVTMLRPRPGGFCYTEAELSVMLRDLEWIDGEFAVGILTPTSEVDVQQLRRFPTSRVVFHRAFDLVPDPFKALEQLIDLGVSRVMADAANHELLARLIDAARGRISVLPAGGVRPSNVRRLVERTGCVQIHGSFKRLTAGSDLGFGVHHETCGDAVRSVRHVLDELSGITTRETHEG